MPPNSPCSFSIIHYATSSVKKCHNRESMAVRVSKLRFVPTLTLMDDLGKVTYSLWISISFTPSSLLFSNRKMTPWGGWKLKTKVSVMGCPLTSSPFLSLPQDGKLPWTMVMSAQSSWVLTLGAGNSALREWILELRNTEKEQLQGPAESRNVWNF